MHSILTIGLPLLAAFFAQQVEATSCNATNPCPSSAPCCSEYGFCGTGHFCLGGCNPFTSKALESCKPEPICKSTTYDLTNTSRIIDHTKYEGTPDRYDWVIEGGEILLSNGTAGPELALLLTEKEPAQKGTKLSSTRYVHYGTITARLKTGQWPGVVTAFITMSDVKDEIDWEWTGSDVTEAQTNLFWQGFIPEKTIGETHGGQTNTFTNFHDYTIDWQPDVLTWSIDGKVTRTVRKADTLDAATGIYRYPTTPSRIQLSVWPAGIEGNSPGVIEWAGGIINWKDPDYVAAGQFYSVVKSVTVKCNNQQQGANLTSYVYSSNGTEPVIAYSNRSTTLKGGAVTVGATNGIHRTVVGAVTLLLIVMHAF